MDYVWIIHGLVRRGPAMGMGKRRLRSSQRRYVGVPTISSEDLRLWIGIERPFFMAASAAIIGHFALSFHKLFIVPQNLGTSGMAIGHNQKK